MKKQKRWASLLLAALLMTSLLCGCGTEKTEETETPLAFSACLGAAPQSLDPAVVENAADSTIILQLYENLLKKQETDGVVGTVRGMAKSYEEKSNEDGTVSYIFKLRQSTHWSDGKAVTADDFVFAWQRLANPANHFANSVLLDMVVGYDAVQKTGDVSQLAVKAIDEHTLQVTLHYPCAYFLNDICTHPATMPQRRDLAGNGATLPVSNGAYVVSSWDAEKLVAKTNPSYYEYRALEVDELHFYFAETEPYALYENEIVDFVMQVPDTVENRKVLPKAAVYTILFQQENDVFADALVRKAFYLSIDYGKLREILGKDTEFATGLVPWGIPDTGTNTTFRSEESVLIDTSRDSYASRSAEAKECLARAGYASGRFFPVVEYRYQTGEVEHQLAVALAKMWEETLSVQVNLKNVSTEQQVTEGYEMAGLWLQGSFDDSVAFLSRWRSNAGNNVISYYNATYDVLMGVTDASQNVTARAAFLHDAERMLLEDAAVLPLYYAETSYQLRETWSGVLVDHIGRVSFSKLHQVTE